MIRKNDEAREPRRASRGQRDDVQLSLFDANTATKKTRAIACASAIRKGPSRREQAFDFAELQGAYGCTSDEISVALGIPAHSVPSIVGALRAAGRLIPTNRTRKTRLSKPAVVYVARGCAPRAAGVASEGSV